MKTGKKFTAMKMLITNLIFLNISLLNFENRFPLAYKKMEEVTNKCLIKGIRILCRHKRTLYSKGEK
jgi:hypothetical protein